MTSYKILGIISMICILLFGAYGCVSNQASVTGTITYRERMALPSDATIQVQIQDVSLADAPAEIIGDMTIPAEGKQVPIPYEVKYNPENIQENHSYSMSVRIEDSSGKLLFISDTHTPVITRGNPTQDVEIVVVPVG